MFFIINYCSTLLIIACYVTFFKMELAEGSKIMTCPLSVPTTRQETAVKSSLLFLIVVMQVITVWDTSGMLLNVVAKFCNYIILVIIN